MKKVFGQTVRDIKRGVNKKVLKLPGIEQKILDATNNEVCVPHVTLLADIAQATRNFNERLIIMSVLWKRVSDTGKNWRHVYKALIVLEYLVAHGSERVIDDITEHAYQISALAIFQYIDSSGRDQGSNVRKKSHSLVVLMNDKERIIEVRQKAEANREKFRSSSTSRMDRPGSYGDVYDDRYNRNVDSYGQYGDHSGRAYEDRYGSDGCKDDDYRVRSQSSDEYQNGMRSSSYDRYRDHAYYNDGQYSSRRSGAQAGDQFRNGGEQEQKLPELNIAPPSYEKAVCDSRSPVQSERNGETAPPSVATASPHVSNNRSHEAVTDDKDASSMKQGIEPSDKFDTLGSVVTPVSAPADTLSSVEMDLLGPLSDPFSSNALAIIPATPAAASLETGAHANFTPGPTYAATPSPSSVMNQVYENPFNTFDEAPSKAIPSPSSDPQPQPSTSAAHFLPTMNKNGQHPQLGTPALELGTNFGFEESFSAITYPASSALAVRTPTNSQFLPQEPSTSRQDVDILADILPPSGPQPLIASQPLFSSSSAQPKTNYYGGFPSQASYAAPNMSPYTQIGAMQGSMALQTQNLQGIQLGSGNAHSLGGSLSPQYPTGSAAQFNGGNYLQQQGLQSAPPNMSGTVAHFNSGNFLPQQGSQVGSQSSLQIMSGTAAQFNGGNFHQQQGSPHSQLPLQTMNVTAAQFNGGNIHQQQGSLVAGSQPTVQTMNGTASQFNGGSSLQQQGSLVAGSQPTLQTMNGTASQFNGGSSLQQQGSLVAGSQPTLQTMNGTASQFNGGSSLQQQGSLVAGSQPTLQTMNGTASQFNGGNSLQQQGSLVAGSQPAFQTMNGSASQFYGGNSLQQQGSQLGSPSSSQTMSGPVAQHNSHMLGTWHQQPGPNTQMASQSMFPASTRSLSTVAQPSRDKFETKSTVWADTLSRGLVDLNISGSKTNPLADIGVDFEAINRKEKRMEKPATSAQVTCTAAMGKAMGSGSGMGRAGVNPMMGPGMGMAMGGGYGGMPQPMGGMVMDMNAGINPYPATGMNMRMGQGVPMQPPNGLPPGSTMPGGYNPMMGPAGYAQQPYSGGYQ